MCTHVYLRLAHPKLRYINFKPVCIYEEASTTNSVPAIWLFLLVPTQIYLLAMTSFNHVKIRTAFTW